MPKRSVTMVRNTQAGDGVDGIIATHLDQQVLAVGANLHLIVTGERGELAL